MTTEIPQTENLPESEVTSDASPPVETFGKAYDLLQQLLNENGGVISNVQFKRDLVSKLGLPEDLATQCVKEFQFLADSEADERVGRKGARTYYLGRSFVSREKHKEALVRTDKEAEKKGEEAEQEEEPVQPEKESVQNRKEEARLGVYVKKALQRIYDSENTPDDAPNVYDVHHERPGSSFENVDLIAIDWRSEETVDLVSVEVKLDFSARAVHQACSYTRF